MCDIKLDLTLQFYFCGFDDDFSL